MRAYPWQTLLMLLTLLLAGVAEGISISALLPLFSLALRQEAAATAADSEAESRVEAIITAVFNTVGISPTIGVLVAIVGAGGSEKASRLPFRLPAIVMQGR